MGLSNRYIPSHPAGQAATYAIDLSNILPPGVAVASGSLQVEQNLVPPVATSDFTIGAASISGRRIYCPLSGGVSARDYRLAWTGVDSLGNTWVRACLLLCAATS